MRTLGTDTCAALENDCLSISILYVVLSMHAGGGAWQIKFAALLLFVLIFKMQDLSAVNAFLLHT